MHMQIDGDKAAKEASLRKAQNTLFAAARRLARGSSERTIANEMRLCRAALEYVTLAVAAGVNIEEPFDP